VLVDADHGDAVEPGRVVDQEPLAFGQDRVVRGVPRDPEPLGDPGDGQVLDHDPDQRPPHRGPGQLGPRLGRRAGVLAPHVSGLTAPVATHRDLQRGGPPTQRLVREATNRGVTRVTLAAAASTPPVGFDHPAREHSPVGFDPLPGDDEAELVESTEGGQVRAGEARRRGSVAHVEVFRDERVGAFILGRPRRLSQDRRARPTYTLIWEEP
jgi:hypothetical protein